MEVGVESSQAISLMQAMENDPMFYTRNSVPEPRKSAEIPRLTGGDQDGALADADAHIQGDKPKKNKDKDNKKAKAKAKIESQGLRVGLVSWLCELFLQVFAFVCMFACRRRKI